MKQSAAKTLGVAALGAAFAAVGAGAANAAPAVPGTPPRRWTPLPTLPAQNAAAALPGAGEALAHGQGALGAGVAAAQPRPSEGPCRRSGGAVAGLLGGLPLQGLPTHGLPVNGLPIG